MAEKGKLLNFYLEGANIHNGVLGLCLRDPRTDEVYTVAAGRKECDLMVKQFGVNVYKDGTEGLVGRTISGVVQEGVIRNLRPAQAFPKDYVPWPERSLEVNRRRFRRF